MLAVGPVVTGRDAQPPPALVTSWCAWGCAGFLVLIGAPVGLTILCLVLGGASWLWHRRCAPPQAPVAPGRAGPATARATHPSVRTPAPSATAVAISRPLPDLPGRAELAQLSDRQLCRAWRTSYVRLQRFQEVPVPTGTAHVSTERARYLDELQRRNPGGFEAWLIAGARAPSDPTRYLTRPIPTQRRSSEG